MKKLLSLTLGLALVSFASAAIADDVTITLKKSSDTKAKIENFSDSKVLAVVPVTFDSGADWDTLLDSYTVSSDDLTKLEAKKSTLSVGTDGALSFHSKK
jgi:hypothetical protein